MREMKILGYQLCFNHKNWTIRLEISSLQTHREDTFEGDNSHERLQKLRQIIAETTLFSL